MSSTKSVNLAATLAKISDLLDIQNRQGYIVGGFIRDWFLGRKTNDIDIAVSGDAVTIAREVAGEIGGKFVLLDDINEVARVVVIEDKQTTGISRNQESRGAEWHLISLLLLGTSKLTLPAAILPSMPWLWNSANLSLPARLPR